MKPIIMILTLTMTLFATEISTRYDVNVGLFGKVGYADLEVQTTKDTYTAKLKAVTTGAAAKLTSGREETYVSEGKIVNGLFLPERFTHTKKTKSAKRVQTYHIDHTTHTVTLDQVEDKKVHETYFDHKSFKIKKREKDAHTEHMTQLPTFTAHDVLSSYLNTARHCHANNKIYNLDAIGAHNENNEVTLTYLGEQEPEAIQHQLSDNGRVYCRLSVKALYEDKKPVNILVAFDNDGHLKEALLGKNFWVGEVKAQRVYHHVSQRD